MLASAVACSPGSGHGAWVPFGSHVFASKRDNVPSLEPHTTSSPTATIAQTGAAALRLPQTGDTGRRHPSSATRAVGPWVRSAASRR